MFVEKREELFATLMNEIRSGNMAPVSYGEPEMIEITSSPVNGRFRLRYFWLALRRFFVDSIITIHQLSMHKKKKNRERYPSQ